MNKIFPKKDTVQLYYKITKTNNKDPCTIIKLIDSYYSTEQLRKGNKLVLIIIISIILLYNYNEFLKIFINTKHIKIIAKSIRYIYLIVFVTLESYYFIKPKVYIK